MPVHLLQVQPAQNSSLAPSQQTVTLPMELEGEPFSTYFTKLTEVQTPPKGFISDETQNPLADKEQDQQPDQDPGHDASETPPDHVQPNPAVSGNRDVPSKMVLADASGSESNPTESDAAAQVFSAGFYGGSGEAKPPDVLARHQPIDAAGGSKGVLPLMPTKLPDLEKAGPTMAKPAPAEGQFVAAPQRGEAELDSGGFTSNMPSVARHRASKQFAVPDVLANTPEEAPEKSKQAAISEVSLEKAAPVLLGKTLLPDHPNSGTIPVSVSKTKYMSSANVQQSDKVTTPQIQTVTPPATVGGEAAKPATVAPESTFDQIQMSSLPLDASPDVVGRLDPLTNITLRSLSDSAVSRPETARWVATQLVEGMPKQPDRPVEIALNPEELGRVRMVLSPSDAGVTVLISTERIETQDLMRRHIELLATEFRRLGYDDIGFEFSNDGGKTSSQPERASSENDSLEQDAPEQHPAKPAQRLASSGLDLRL